MLALTSSITTIPNSKIPTFSKHKFPQTTFRNPTKKFIPRAENNESEHNGEDLKKKNRGPGLNLKWVDLVLDPDPDNVVAVGLTGVLAWASVQVLWQLFFISLAILVAALKYSFIAALLIFILITLL